MTSWGQALDDAEYSSRIVYVLVYHLLHLTLLCKLLKDVWQLVRTPRSLHLDPRRFRLCKLTAFAVSVALVYLNHVVDGFLDVDKLTTVVDASEDFWHSVLLYADTSTQHAMLLVCMLLAYAIPSTVRYSHDGAKEAWSIVGSLFVLFASSIANLAHRLLSVHGYQAIVKDEHTTRFLLLAYGDLALTFVLLVATLCAFLLAGHGLRKWVTHRIEGRAALICEYREQLITPSGSAACWGDIRREAFRSWVVAHTSNPELLLARSVLATLLSLILGQCYVVQIYCWSRVQDQGMFIETLDGQTEGLRLPLLTLGLLVVCWRSLLAVALFPRARQKTTGQQGTSSQFFMVEDFWIRSLLDSIQFACAKYPMDQKKTASRRCLLIYCSLLIRPACLYVKLSFCFLLVALLYVIVLFGKVWWLILEASTIPFKWLTGAFSGCRMHGALHNVDEYMSNKIIEDAVFCLPGEQRKAVSEAASSALLEKLRGLNLDMRGSNQHQSMDELLDLMKMVDTQQFTGLRKYMDSCLLIKSKVPITNPHGWVEEIGDSSWLVVTTSLVALLELLGSANESECQYKILIKLVKWVKRSHKQAMDMIRLVDSVTDQTSSLGQSTELQTRFLDKRFWKTLSNKLSYHHPLQEVDVGDDDPFLQTLTTLRKSLVGSNMEGVHVHLHNLTGGDLVQEAGLLMLLKLCNYALQIEDFVKKVDNKGSSDELAMSYGQLGITITMCLVQTYVDIVGACLSCLPWACVSQMYKAANKCDDGKVATLFPIVYKAETIWKHEKWPIGSPGRQHSTPLMYSTPILSKHNHPNAPTCSIWNVPKPPKRSHTPLKLVSYPGPFLQEPMDIQDPLSLLKGFTLSNYP